MPRYSYGRCSPVSNGWPIATLVGCSSGRSSPLRRLRRACQHSLSRHLDIAAPTHSVCGTRLARQPANPEIGKCAIVELLNSGFLGATLARLSLPVSLAAAMPLTLPL